MAIACYLRHLREEDFRTEKLQRERSSLLGNACFGGTVDVSAAYHHEHMRPDAMAYATLDSSGKATSSVSRRCHSAWPRLRGCFTAVMGHTVRFLRYGGFRVLPDLDGLILEAAVAVTTVREVKLWARCFSTSSRGSAGSSTRPSASGATNLLPNSWCWRRWAP